MSKPKNWLNSLRMNYWFQGIVWISISAWIFLFYEIGKYSSISSAFFWALWMTFMALRYGWPNFIWDYVFKTYVPTARRGK